MPPWVGAWLREVRTASDKQDGLAEIAERLNRDMPAISRIETGKISIPSDDLPLVLCAYDVTPEQFAEQVKRRAA